MREARYWSRPGCPVDGIVVCWAEATTARNRIGTKRAIRIRRCDFECMVSSENKHSAVDESAICLREPGGFLASRMFTDFSNDAAMCILYVYTFFGGWRWVRRGYSGQETARR